MIFLNDDIDPKMLQKAMDVGKNNREAKSKNMSHFHSIRLLEQGIKFYEEFNDSIALSGISSDEKNKERNKNITVINDYNSAINKLKENIII